MGLLRDAIHAFFSVRWMIVTAAHLVWTVVLVRPFHRHPHGWTPLEELAIGFYACLCGCRDINVLRFGLWLQSMTALPLALLPYGPAVTRVPGDVDGRERGWWLQPPHSYWAGSQHLRKLVIFHIHGGGFAVGHPLMHAMAQAHLLRQLRHHNVSARIFSPRYPLSHEASHPSALHAVLAAYTWLSQNVAADEEIVVGGDSAGANLALALMGALRDGMAVAGGPTPVHTRRPLATLLISPWANLSASSLVKRPAVLGTTYDFVNYDELKGYARAYVGDAKGTLGAAPLAARLSHPQVSPALASSFAGLVDTQMMVVAGALEIMLPDIRALVGRLFGDGVDVVYHEEPHMVHVYCLAPAPSMYHRQLPMLNFLLNVLERSSQKGGGKGDSSGGGAYIGGQYPGEVGGSGGVTSPRAAMRVATQPPPSTFR